MPKEKTPLLDVVSRVYPSHTKIVLPLAEKWEYVDQIQDGKLLLFVGSLPTAPFRAEPDEFNGLSVKINLLLRYMKTYRLFQPININSQQEEYLSMTSDAEMSIQLFLRGEALIWFGEEICVIDHCYLYKENGLSEDAIYSFWKSIENSISVKKFYTKSTEVYWINNKQKQLLTQLGYLEDPNFAGWSSKVLSLPSV